MAEIDPNIVLQSGRPNVQRQDPLDMQTKATQVQALRSQMDEGRFKMAQQRLGAISSGVTALLARPDLQSSHVRGMLEGLMQQGILPPEQGMQMIDNTPQDPAQLRPFLAQHQQIGDRLQSAKIEEIAQQTKKEAQEAARMDDLLRRVRGGQPVSGPADRGTGGAPITPAQPSSYSKIPADALEMDLLTNRGKNIPEWLYKQYSPNMVNVDGVVTDLNAVGPGYSVPTISSSGQASIRKWDPVTQQWTVSAPRGAMETYQGYRNIDEGVKAASELVPGYDPREGRPTVTTRASQLAMINPPAGRPGSPEAQASADTPESIAEQIRLIKTNGGQPVTPAMQPAIDREVARLETKLRAAQNATPGVSPYGVPAGPTDTEKSTSAEAKAYKDIVIKNTAEVRNKLMSDGRAAPMTISKLTHIGSLLKNVDGGVFTGTLKDIASAANTFGINIDNKLPYKEAAVQMARGLALNNKDELGPGIMTDSDFKILESLQPNLGQSAEARQMIIEARVRIEKRKMDQARAARNYEKKHGKIDEGFFEQWDNWVEQNPLFEGMGPKPKKR